MDLKKIFGANVKKLRNEKKYTQFELAEMLEIDEKHLSHIETGRSFPKAILIEKLCEVLDIDLPTLFNFPRNKNRENLLNKIDKFTQNASDDDLDNLLRIIEICFNK